MNKIENFNIIGLPNDENQLRKKKIMIISIIIMSIIVVSIIIIVVVVVIKNKSNSNNLNESTDGTSDDILDDVPDDISDVLREFNLSTLFYFDPVSESPYSEKNYWTPFDNTTTCYKWISITYPDTNAINTIKIMLDHNIATSTFSEYKNILKNKTYNWARYKNKIDIIYEATIFELMNYSNKSDKANKGIPSVIVNPFSTQLYYILDDKGINQKGYQTITPFEDDTLYSYAIDYNGNNEVISIESVYGIRLVLNIKKSLLTIGPGAIEITDIIKKGIKIYYECENELYDGMSNIKYFKE